MPFCSNCGNVIKTGAKFCSKCGAQMSISDPGAGPVCHKPVAGDEKFCMHCGSTIAHAESGRISSPSPQVVPQPQASQLPPVYAQPPVSGQVKKKKKSGCVWKTLLILLFIGIAGITALWFYGDEPVGSETEYGELTGTDIPGIVSIDDTMSGETMNEITPDTGEPRQAAEAVEDAFARADTTLLKQMLTPNSREIYKEAFKEIKPYMNEYSKAFSNRKLKLSTPIYSLYEFTDEAGKKYTAEFALSDDGQWKLVRF